MGGSGYGISGIGWDGDTGGGQLIVVDAVEDAGFIGLGVQPWHVIQLTSEHQEVVVSCDCLCVAAFCVPTRHTLCLH